MPRPEPAVASRALALLRTARGWKKNELAAALGLRPSLVYSYEAGDVAPSRELLERAAAALGYPAAVVDRALAFLGACDASAAGEALPVEREAREIAAELGHELESFVGGLLGRVAARARAFAERQMAPVLWARLAEREPEARRALVEESGEGDGFRSWALAEQVSEASVAMAAADADQAIELAELAVLIAGLAPGEPAWRARLQGWARAHLGNALRVKGDLAAADEAFRVAAELWRQGASGDPERLLDESRLLDLEASLRREQRRLPEALALLDRALAADRSGARTAHIFVIRAKTLEELGDYEEAIATLRRAEPHIMAARDPRLLWSHRFNVIVNLCHLDRFEEAAPLLDGVRDLARRLGNPLDLVRLLWLEGRVAAGQGDRLGAEAALDRVRQAFTGRRMAYDAALATLELAVLRLEGGRAAEAAALAKEIAWVFEAQGLSVEALAAVRLFHEAARRHTLDLALARRLLADLRRAPREPGNGQGQEGPGRKGGAGRPRRG